ncbi:MAG: DUF2182 domain-containing protein [Spartobacteria bacterium]
MPSLALILKRDRWWIVAGVLFVAVVAWWWTIDEARRMEAMPMSAPDRLVWTAATLGPLFVMWIIMMVAMMLPSALPMILTFASVARRRRQEARPFVPVTIFVAGYLAIWGGFSVVAAVAQWLLHREALLSPMMQTSSALVGGILLLLAGIFQFTPLKRSCLNYCRAPLDFVMTRWREGRKGAFTMGLEHGLFCAGCCWALMALLFVLGVMNLFWIAGLAVLVGLEKMLPGRVILTRVSGVLLIAWACWILARA